MQRTIDPANVAQSLTYTLLDVFDATRDLYQTLRSKQKRDYEQNLRSRGYRTSIDYLEDELDGEEEIVMDKAAVLRQFDIGLQDVGTQFAVGDGTQTFLQIGDKRLQRSTGFHRPESKSLLKFSSWNSICVHPSVRRRTDLYSHISSRYTVSDHYSPVGHHHDIPLWTYLARTDLASSQDLTRSFPGSRHRHR